MKVFLLLFAGIVVASAVVTYRRSDDRMIPWDRRDDWTTWDPYWNAGKLCCDKCDRGICCDKCDGQGVHTIWDHHWDAGKMCCERCDRGICCNRCDGQNDQPTWDRRWDDGKMPWNRRRWL